MKHTPGPWIQSAAFISGEDSVHVATLNYMGSNLTNANGRLIAAAPDLLEACREAEEALKLAPENWMRRDDAIKKLAQVIAKAEGRS